MPVSWDALNPGDDSPHLVAYHETLWADEYHLQDRDPDLRVIVDLGANVGYFAIRAAELFPHAHITAVEPDPDNYTLLGRNLGISGFADRVTTFEEAVWSETGWVDLNAGHAGLSWVAGDERPTTTVMEIQAVSLDELLAPFERVDLLKCDIEGGEYPVFDAVSHDTLDKIDALAMEIHWWSGAPRRRPAFVAKLSDHFSLDGVTEGSGMLYGQRR